MAWYAWTKRHNGWNFLSIDMIGWYRWKLHEDWFNSLSEEDKQRVLEFRRKREEKERHKHRVALAKLMALPALIGSIYGPHDRMC